MRKTDSEGTIRRIRRGIPLTLEATAKKAGISVGHLSEIERGRVLPSPYTIAKIAVALEQRFDHLIVAVTNEYSGKK